MIVGVDFGAPRWAREQRRKIIAIGARAAAWRRYRVDSTGINARLLVNEAPGWSAAELVDELLARPARVVGLDAPFGVPHALLHDPAFAGGAGRTHGPFHGWRDFNHWIAQRLPLTDPLDFSAFAAWRDPAARGRLWARRATDVAAGAQPPLKDRFQATFQMMLLANAVLARLWASGRYRVLPFGGRGAGEIVEVYPRATLRAMGLTRYKAQPDEAVRLAIAACAAAGIRLDVDARLVALACRYSSGTAAAPDHDVADAFVALCTAILHAENACRPAVAPDAMRSARYLMEHEGAIWIPTITTSATVRGPATVRGDERDVPHDATRRMRGARRARANER